MAEDEQAIITAIASVLDLPCTCHDAGEALDELYCMEHGDNIARATLIYELVIVDFAEENGSG